MIFNWYFIEFQRVIHLTRMGRSGWLITSWIINEFENFLNNPQSECYNVSKLNNIFNTTQGKRISLFHCNIRSLTKNLTLSNDVLCSLDSTPDIVTVTETRLSSNSISNLDIPKYNFFHTDSPTRAGGAAIYVNKVLKAIPRSDLKIDLPLVESCWVEIDPNNNRKLIMIGCMYKHDTRLQMWKNLHLNLMNS